MKVIVDTYERLEEKERELVQGGYKQTDITKSAIIFSRFICGHKSEVKLIPAFWEANKGRV